MPSTYPGLVESLQPLSLMFAIALITYLFHTMFTFRSPLIVFFGLLVLAVAIKITVDLLLVPGTVDDWEAKRVTAVIILFCAAIWGYAEPIVFGDRG